MLFKYLSVLFFASSLLLSLAGRLEASCGLHTCPIPVAVNRQTFPSQASIEPVYTAFDIGGRGSFVQTNLVGVYEHRLFRAGGLVPVVYLNSPTGDKSVGLANPLPYGEFYILNESTMKFSVGTQFELPIANHDKGFGEHHWMVMPYLNFWKIIQDWRFAVQTGFLQALNHDDDMAAVYVNPHSDSEFAARAMASYTFWEIWTAEVNASLRQVVDHHAEGDKTFFDLGTAARAQLGQSMALRGGVNIPVTSTQRYLFQAYLGMYYYF